MPDPAGLRGVTPRERQILELAALGMSNRQIGTQLAIAEQTVKNHLFSAMKKLSLHDRTQAVVLALNEGWISVPIAEGAERSPAEVAATGEVHGTAG